MLQSLRILLFIPCFVLFLHSCQNDLPEDPFGENSYIDDGGNGSDSDYPLDKAKYFDKDAKLTREEFAKMLSDARYREEVAAKKTQDIKREAEDKYHEEFGSAPIIPDMKNILIAPKIGDVGNGKLISLSVTEDVPLKDVIMEVGSLADVEMRIDPKISGGIILRVKNRSFENVMKMIASMANLRYFVKDGVVHVERDLAHVKNYSVDFLNLVRSNSANLDINTKTGSGGEGAGGDVQSGSSSSINSRYDGDLWGEVESNLEKILGVKKDDSTAVVEGKSAEDIKFFAVNRQAGVITIAANDIQHEVIHKYLDALKTSVSSQVIIEAKLVEVSLKDDYRTGINWNQHTAQYEANNVLLSPTDGTGAIIPSLQYPVSGVLGGDSLTTSGPFGGVFDNVQPFSIGIIDSGLDINATVSMLEEFGTSRTLASPRIHAMNNQQAILTFVTNSVYFELEVDTEEESAAGSGNVITQVDITSDARTVPVGIILNLQPSIDLENQEVTMTIRPTISNITGTVSDPAAAFLNIEGIANNIPVIEVKELDSIIRIKSGQVMVIGGLMEESNVNQDSGIPFLSSIPIVGNLFKSVIKTKETVETVIFIKATIVPSSGVKTSDQEFYRTFVKEPSPLTF